MHLFFAFARSLHFDKAALISENSSGGRQCFLLLWLELSATARILSPPGWKRLPNQRPISLQLPKFTELTTSDQPFEYRFTEHSAAMCNLALNLDMLEFEKLIDSDSSVQRSTVLNTWGTPYQLLYKFIIQKAQPTSRNQRKSRTLLNF